MIFYRIGYNYFGNDLYYFCEENRIYLLQVNQDNIILKISEDISDSIDQLQMSGFIESGMYVKVENADEIAFLLLQICKNI